MPRKKQAPVKMARNTGNNLPAVPTGMAYGAHQAAEQSIAAMPVAGQPGATSPPAAPGGPAADPAQQLAAVQQYQPQTGDLMAGTQRPGEPVTAGLPSGPGPGPEGLGVDPGTQDVLAWRPYLPGLEFMASQPDATMSTRNFVRRLRSMMPITAPPGTTPPGVGP